MSEFKSSVPNGWLEFLEQDSSVLGHVQRQELAGLKNGTLGTANWGGLGIGGTGSENSQVEVSQPIPIYLLSSEAVTVDGLKAGEPWSWRCVFFRSKGDLGAQKESILAVDFVVRKGVDSIKLLALLEGDALRQFVAGLDVADSVDRLSEYELTVRLLEIPKLFFSSLWLAGDDPGRDVFVPLVGQCGFKAREPYSGYDVYLRLKKAATQRARADKRSLGK